MWRQRRLFCKSLTVQALCLKDTGDPGCLSFMTDKKCFFMAARADPARLHVGVCRVFNVLARLARRMLHGFGCGR